MGLPKINHHQVSVFSSSICLQVESSDGVMEQRYGPISAELEWRLFPGDYLLLGRKCGARKCGDKEGDKEVQLTYT